MHTLIQVEKGLKIDKCSLNEKIRDLQREFDYQKSYLQNQVLLLQMELKESKSELLVYRKCVVVMALVVAFMLFAGKLV